MLYKKNIINQNISVFNFFNSCFIGFTLIELLIVLLLISLISSVGFSTINFISVFQLKKGVSDIRGYLRRVYSLATFSCFDYRIVFNVYNGTYFLERSLEKVVLLKKPHFISLDINQKEFECSSNNYKNVKHGEFFVNKYVVVESNLGFEQRLPLGISFRSIWVEESSLFLDNDIVYLYFFSGGYSQKAYIELMDQKIDNSTNIIQVIIEPLTGEITEKDKLLEEDF